MFRGIDPHQTPRKTVYSSDTDSIPSSEHENDTDTTRPRGSSQVTPKVVASSLGSIRSYQLFGSGSTSSQERASDFLASTLRTHIPKPNKHSEDEGFNTRSIEYASDAEEVSSGVIIYNRSPASPNGSVGGAIADNGDGTPYDSGHESTDNAKEEVSELLFL